MMKKDYNKLKKGDSFIRKGSHQPPMIRADFDKIIEKKIKANSYDGEVEVVFGDNNLTQIDLHAVGDFILSSDRAAKEISEIIEKKRNMSPYEDIFSLPKALGAGFLFGSIPYENRSIEVLEKNLETVRETYREDDIYELYELYSHKINLDILNQGINYIEDASIFIEIEKVEGLYIATRVFSKPKNGYLVSGFNYVPSYESLHYPTVEYKDSSIVIISDIGDIRHKIATPAFKVPVRMVFGNQLIGQTLKVKYTIYGKNLVQPLENAVTINVIPKES